MRATKTLAILALLAASTALTACGGGGGGGGNGNGGTASSSGAIPNTVTGLIAYLQELIANTSETAEPVALGEGELPVDDTAEPSAI